MYLILQLNTGDVWWLGAVISMLFYLLATILAPLQNYRTTDTKPVLAAQHNCEVGRKLSECDFYLIYHFNNKQSRTHEEDVHRSAGIWKTRWVKITQQQLKGYQRLQQATRQNDYTFTSEWLVAVNHAASNTRVILMVSIQASRLTLTCCHTQVYTYKQKSLHHLIHKGPVWRLALHCTHTVRPFLCYCFSNVTPTWAPIFFGVVWQVFHLTKL